MDYQKYGVTVILWICLAIIGIPWIAGAVYLWSKFT